MGNCCRGPPKGVAPDPARETEPTPSDSSRDISGSGGRVCADVLYEVLAGGDIGLIIAERMEDFSFRGRRFAAKVVHVYDGDTIRIVFRDRGALVQYRARMAGYDSPEMKPRLDSPNRNKEVAAATDAKFALEGRISGKVVLVECGAADKYGRLLVTVYAPERGALTPRPQLENINEWMLASGYGVPYDGGKKTRFGEGARRGS